MAILLTIQGERNTMNRTLIPEPCRVYWPLSRCMNRCDRMIQNECRYPNGGNVRCFHEVSMCPARQTVNGQSICLASVNHMSYHVRSRGFSSVVDDGAK